MNENLDLEGRLNVRDRFRNIGYDIKQSFGNVGGKINNIYSTVGNRFMTGLNNTKQKLAKPSLYLTKPLVYATIAALTVVILATTVLGSGCCALTSAYAGKNNETKQEETIETKVEETDEIIETEPVETEIPVETVEEQEKEFFNNLRKQYPTFSGYFSKLEDSNNERKEEITKLDSYLAKINNISADNFSSSSLDEFALEVYNITKDNEIFEDLKEIKDKEEWVGRVTIQYDELLKNDKIMEAINFFSDKNQIDKLLALTPPLGNWNDLYGILKGRSDEVISQYIDESIEYSGKINALVVTCGLNSDKYDTALFKYFLEKRNVPLNVVQNYSREELIESAKGFYSNFAVYPIIKEAVDDINKTSDSVKRDKTKQEILDDIASAISNPDTSLDIICLTSDYKNAEDGIEVYNKIDGNETKEVIYPNELAETIEKNYVDGKKLIFITNFCYSTKFVRDMGMDNKINVVFISSGSEEVSLSDLPESFFALAEKGITLADLKHFGDDSTINDEYVSTHEGKTYNRRASIFEFDNFLLYIDNNELANFQPSIIYKEQILEDKPLIPYNIRT